MAGSHIPSSSHALTVTPPIISPDISSVLPSPCVPDAKLAWRHVWLGAVLTAGLFTVGKYGLALYFKYATPTSAFGAAGSLAAVLLWVYYSSFILFFGAEFTKVWALNHGHRAAPEEHAEKMTDEDRAQRGIPSEKRLESAQTDPRVDVGMAQDATGAPGFGAYFLAAVAFLGGWGARLLVDRRDRNMRTMVAGTKLDTRLRSLEKRIGRVPLLRSGPCGTAAGR